MSLVTSERIRELWAEIKSKIYFKTEQTQDIVDGSVSNATLTLTRRDGTTKGLTVNNVSNATNATLATKATQDGSGNVITSTYATKTELNAKAPTASPTFTGTVTAATVTVTSALNIPGGKIWIE